MVNEMDVSDSALPRRRNMPKRFKIGEAPLEFHSTPKEYYHQIYYEAIDLIACAVQSARVSSVPSP